MKKTTKHILAFTVVLVAVFAACKKDKDVPLPTIAGYNNSDEVASANLKSYWSFEGNGNESKSGAAPTSSAGVTYSAGVKGQGGVFANGYIYLAEPCSFR
jgi:hypothetical protein